LNEEYEKLIDELHNRDSYINGLEGENKHFKKLIDFELPKCNNLDKIKQQNENLKNELEKFKKENSLLKNNLRGDGKEIVSLEKGIKNKNNQLEDFQIKLEELENLIINKDDLIADLETRIEELNKAFELKDSEIKKYSKLTQEFNSENKNSIEELMKQATNTIKVFYNNLNLNNDRINIDSSSDTTNFQSDLFSKAEIDNLLKENKIPLILEEVLSKDIPTNIKSLPKELFNTLLFKTDLLKTELFSSLIREMGIVKYLSNNIDINKIKTEGSDNNIPVSEVCNIIAQQMEDYQNEIQRLNEENKMLALQNEEFEGMVNSLQENLQLLKHLIETKFGKIDDNIKSLSEQKQIKTVKINELYDTINHYKRKAVVQQPQQYIQHVQPQPLLQQPLRERRTIILKPITEISFTINSSIMTNYIRSSSQDNRVIREVRYERSASPSPENIVREVRYERSASPSPENIVREVRYERSASPENVVREVRYERYEDQKPKIVNTYNEERRDIVQQHVRPPKIEYVIVKDKPINEKQIDFNEYRKSETVETKKDINYDPKNVKIIYTTSKQNERNINYGLRDEQSPGKEETIYRSEGRESREIPILKKKPERGILKNSNNNISVTESGVINENYDYELSRELLNNKEKQVLKAQATPTVKNTTSEVETKEQQKPPLKVQHLNNVSIDRTYPHLIQDKLPRYKTQTVNYFSIYCYGLEMSFNEKNYQTKKDEANKLHDELNKTSSEVKRLRDEIASLLRTNLSLKEVIERKEAEKKNYKIYKNYFSIEPIDIPRVKPLDESLHKIQFEENKEINTACQNCIINAEILNDFKNTMKSSTFKELKQFYLSYQMDIDKVSGKFEELMVTFGNIDKQLADANKKIKKAQIRDVVAHLGKFVATLGGFMTKYNKDLSYQSGYLKKLFDFISKMIFSSSFLSSFSSIKTLKITQNFENLNKKQPFENLLKIIFDVNKVFSPTEFKKISQLYENKNILEVIEIFKSVCDLIKTNMLDYKLDYESKIFY
jgi:hypothetical protein